MPIPLSINVDIKSETLNKAMELIARAGYILYEPTRIKQKAKAKADAKLITEKNELNISILQRQTLGRILAIETSRQENINRISQKVFGEIASSGKQIDPLTDVDWIKKYFSFSQDISNEEMQNVWSKILAGELINAGSFSYKTMSILANMRKQEAELFSRLCTFVLVINDFRFVPLIFSDPSSDGKYNQSSINFEELQFLESLGLIHFNSVSSYSLTISNKEFTIGIGSKNYLFKTSEDKIKLGVGDVLLTKEGQELFKVVNAIPNAGLIEVVKKEWVTASRSISEL